MPKTRADAHPRQAGGPKVLRRSPSVSTETLNGPGDAPPVAFRGLKRLPAAPRAGRAPHVVKSSCHPTRSAACFRTHQRTRRTSWCGHCRPRRHCISLAATGLHTARPTPIRCVTVPIGRVPLWPNHVGGGQRTIGKNWRITQGDWSKPIMMSTIRAAHDTRDSAAFGRRPRCANLIDRGRARPPGAAAARPERCDLLRCRVGVSRPTVRAGLRTRSRRLGVVITVPRRGLRQPIFPTAHPRSGSDAPQAFSPRSHKVTGDDVYEARADPRGRRGPAWPAERATPDHLATLADEVARPVRVAHRAAGLPGSTNINFPSRRRRRLG